ncbi:universal stress protein [Sungkyunkwania multivorans]|uniref:Universal stress protein n=1 Tax=Sungkyunkwania multivorans TaxID=1173618 RepID=A0ABW3D491_9FLAO
MNKIIVPIDFSEYSDYALEVAANLAKANNAEILALHMLEISESLVNKAEGSDYSEALFFMKLAKKKFENFLEKDYLEGVKVTDIVQYHKVFSEVNNTAIEQGADLIVMGSHGASGAKELFVGSNAEKVVRNSELPVLVVKQRRKDFSANKVVFASDFKRDNVRPYLNAMSLFKKIKADVSLLYVNLPNESFKDSDEIEKQLKEFFIKADGNTDNMKKVTVRNDYSVEKGLFAHGQKVDADVLAIPTHGRKGLSHFFIGSIGEDIVNHANTPVMTFKI